jgi:hypothetical protein
MRTPPAALRRMLRPYGARIARLFCAARAAVLAAAPQANELIYDAYNTVSAVYSSSERLADAFCHVAAYRDYVNLGFNEGARLPDPERLLVGSGTNIRHIRIAGVDILRDRAVQRLLTAAVAHARGVGVPTGAKPQSIIKPASAKKRRPT